MLWAECSRWSREVPSNLNFFVALWTSLYVLCSTLSKSKSVLGIIWAELIALLAWKEEHCILSALGCVWPEFSSTADFQQRGFELSGRRNYLHCPLWRRWIVADKIGWRSFVSLCLVFCIQNTFFFATSVLELSCKQSISAGKWEHLWGCTGT